MHVPLHDVIYKKYNLMELHLEFGWEVSFVLLLICDIVLFLLCFAKIFL